MKEIVGVKIRIYKECLMNGNLLLGYFCAFDVVVQFINIIGVEFHNTAQRMTFVGFKLASVFLEFQSNY